MRRKRGFTLVEVMVVTAVIAIGAAVATPLYFRALERADRRAVVRSAQNHIQFVRMAAVAHGSHSTTGQFQGIPGLLLPVIVSPSPGLVALMSLPSSMFRAPPTYTALRVLTPTSYQLIAKRNGVEQTLGIVVVNEDVRTMRIAFPLALQEIRFSSRGHRDVRSAPALVLQDATSGERHTIEVSLTGMTTVN